MDERLSRRFNTVILFRVMHIYRGDTFSHNDVESHSPPKAEAFCWLDVTGKVLMKDSLVSREIIRIGGDNNSKNWCPIAHLPKV